MREAFPARDVEDGRRFLEVAVHVLKDAADENVGERGVVKSKDHRDREPAIDEPLRNRKASQCLKLTNIAAGDGGVDEEVLPEERERPLGHDVREDEDGGDKLLKRHVGARNQEGHDPAEEDCENASEGRDEEASGERQPEVADGKVGTKEDGPPIIPGESPLGHVLARPSFPDIPNQDIPLAHRNGIAIHGLEGRDEKGEERIKIKKEEHEGEEDENRVRRHAQEGKGLRRATPDGLKEGGPFFFRGLIRHSEDFLS